MTETLTAPPRKPLPTSRPATVRKRAYARRLIRNLLVALLVIVELTPLVWLLLSSFKTQSEFVNDPAWSLPGTWDLHNYAEAWTTGHVALYVRNSLLATVPSLALIIVLGTAAGFALEVMIWRGRHQVLLVFLLGIMVPSQMILLPLFRVYFQSGLSGTMWPLIITYTAVGLPLTVFMMATYFRAVPREMFEAATLDGASMLTAFWRIGFPVVRNAVFTVALVQFFFIWNDLLISLTFTTDDDLRTIQVGLLNFTGQYGETSYGPLFAAISINVVGALVLYLLINQRIIKGLTAGAVKG
ncbi:MULTISPECIES: carbohydrate ABC transporter permease [Streptomyces]|uniref:Putative permease component of ABC transporter n=1 Tax=Streptomyces scabiei (strain 87.22) TaxID=680198 RepID=C9Z039_STRSW|nr:MULTISPECIES: carbohydrate ABC transporter permease [Streptomyces]MBP5865651.1 carbohydrate ABC transporter permease [Streptomyces sp. LBUM 1484]MBP5872388.1 carbohydrate ABC transporter permease [Streptomyces sp. LBUM 1485]MBP5933736.1 carbohydrate ABC transporter permease [Streptomyces sp. LBUM 1479]KFG04264.1 ABC transporter permease [Streptomyces scabiei]MBP5873632.1 carbohydrate ABC transporter permease [Streptomyces sp. LBUM 1477]